MEYKKDKFREKLVEVHGRQWNRAWKRLSRKASALKQSLKKRSEEYDVLFDVSLDDIKKLFYLAYNKKCKYCDKTLNVRNMVCDHIIPLSKQGKSIPKNLQMICKTCNTRKGALKEKDFKYILSWLSEQTEEISKYVLSKLSKGGKY